MESHLHTINTQREHIVQQWITHIPQWVHPNIITGLRLTFLPAILILFDRGAIWWTMIFVVIVFTTDIIDGTLARTRNQITAFGKILDPLADKILFLSLLVFMGWNILPHAIIWASIVLDGLSLLRGAIPLIWVNARNIRQANIYGKAKASLQFVGIVLLLITFKNEIFLYPTITLLWTSLVFAGLSIIHA